MFRPVSDEADKLATELESLRIDRDSPRTKPGCAERSRNRFPVFALLIGVAIVATGLVFFYARSQKSHFFSTEVELVSATLLSPAAPDVLLVSTGYVAARQKATVAPKMTGRIARLLVAEGDRVAPSQVLAELEASSVQAESTELSANIAAGHAKVESAKTEVADAEIKLGREKALASRGAGTQASLDDADAHLVSARARLNSAQADVRSIEAHRSATAVALENTKVRAPIGGTILRKFAEVGEVVPVASPTGIFSLASLDDMEVQADVSESQIGKIFSATPAEIVLDAYPSKRFRGEVHEIRQMVDRAKAAVMVKVRFVDKTVGVLPDMAAKVSFLSRPLDEKSLQAPSKLVAPADAVVERGGRKCVLTLDGERVHELPVTLGDTLGSSIELRSGVAAGTRVIAHPPAELGEGSVAKEKKN